MSDVPHPSQGRISTEDDGRSRRFECAHCGKIHEDHVLAAMCCVQVSALSKCGKCGRRTFHPLAEGDSPDSYTDEAVCLDPQATILFACENCGSVYSDVRDAVVCCAAEHEVIVDMRRTDDATG